MGIVVKAYGKINIFLDCLKKRDDGYHEVKMVMQSVRLHDLVEIRKAEKNSVFTDSLYVPNNKNNLALKAASLLQEKGGVPPVAIKIKKNIPVSAGMAGGSTDAAALLRALDVYYDKRLSLDALCQLGAKVGSDVPFCILGGTAITEEKGQLLFPIIHEPQAYYVIVKPEASISTKEMYEQLDREGIPAANDTKRIVNGFRNQNVAQIAKNLYNVFEPLAIQRVPEIGKIKQQLKQYGALNAQMTGSGSAVYGIFDSLETAMDACDTLREKYPETFLATNGDFDEA